MANEPTHIYVSGPMRKKVAFNFPAFFLAERGLRRIYPDADICNPAREDVVRFGLQHMLNSDPTGHLAGAYLQEHPEMFDHAALRTALGQDMAYICQHCDLLVLLPGWEESSGAAAEIACAKALGIQIVQWTDTTDGYVRLSDHLAGATPSAAQEAAETVKEAPVADSVPPASPCAEVRTRSTTGGEKGVKLAAFDQVSPEVEMLVAEHFGKGARKYAAHNFRRGYEWSKSYSALRRHLAAFWAGEEYDSHLDTCPEDCTDHTGSLHIVAVIWHAMVLTEFYLHHKEFDDRYVY